MKRVIALLSVLLLLAGCGAQSPAKELPVTTEAPTTAEETITAETTEAEVTEAEVTEAEVTEAEVTETEVVEEPVIDTPAAAENAFGTFSAQTLDGETITDAIFTQADLTVVNLWGTFCGPCINEMPTLGKLHEELENVQVLGIVLDCTDQSGNPDPAQVQTALDITAATGANYPTVVLNMDLVMLGMANYQYIPTTLFVDNSGNIIGAEHVGALDEAGWHQVIAERLEMIGK